MTMLSGKELVAHRGWQNRYPENTLPAISAALEAGALNIEVDVQLSGDGVAMLFHDQRLERLCGQPGSIFDFSATELQGIVAHEPERFGQQHFDTTIATLEQGAELIARFPRANFYVELKKQSIYHFGRQAFLEAVEQALTPIKHQVVLISFDIPILKLARKRGWLRVGPVLSYWRQRKSKSVLALEPDCAFCNTQLIPRRTNLHRMPLKLVVYEVGTLQEAREWRARGVDKVETFCVGEMLSEMEAIVHDPAH